MIKADMMKKISIFTLLLTFLIIMIGCDNGSVSNSAVSDGLVKVCLTVGDDSSDMQKSISVSGSEWSSYTFQYNAVPQWVDPQGVNIQGAAGWTEINYSTGMSLGYFAPGQWVFGVRLLNGSTVVYEGYSEIIEVKNASVNVDVLVNKLVTNAVAGSVRIVVTAPAEEDDTLTINYSGDASGGPYTVTATSDSAKYPFEYLVNDDLDPDDLDPPSDYTFTLTLTHSDRSIEGSIDVTLASGEMAVISGHLDNGRWQLECSIVKVYSVITTHSSHGIVQANTTSAAVGDRVSFYANPASGSRLISVSVTCGGNQVANTHSGKLYSFIMPDGKVTISATFEEVDTSISLSHFKIILKSFYDGNPGVTAFGRSETGPSDVEYLGIKDVKIWYDNGQIYWYSDAGNEIIFNDEDTSMANLFKDCTKYVHISMKGIKTANITNMSGMFENCVNLATVDLYGVRTPAVTNMANMFYKAGYNYFPHHDTGVDGYNTEDNLTNLTISNMEFDTTLVTDMSQMFSICAVTDLSGTNIGSWNTGSVTTFYRMFAGYGTPKSPYKYWYNKLDSDTFDISGWDTHSCTNFANMFDYCNRLKAMNMSGWNFSAAIDMSRMFDRCENIKTITFPPLQTVLTNVTTLTFIFANCDLLDDDAYENIFKAWYIDGCRNNGNIDFSDVGGNSENANRITKTNNNRAIILQGAPRYFKTYGHENDNIYIKFGGAGWGSGGVSNGRMVWYVEQTQ